MRNRPRWLVSAALLALVLTACSSTATPSPATNPPAATPSSSPSVPVASPSPSVIVSSPASLPPPSAMIGFTGAVAGVKQISVGCNFPALTGQTISLFGPTNVALVDAQLTVAADNVTIRLASGSGATFTVRAFSGSGVTDFDAAKGATIDSPLTEIDSGGAHGKIPAITSVKGVIDCGNQIPGSSTLTLSGTVPEGAISGPVDPVRVDCSPNTKPPTVHAIGLIKVGTTIMHFVFAGSATGFTAYVVGATTVGAHFYTSTDPSVVTISPTGAHVSGTASEAKTPNTLAVSGDLACGIVNP